MFRRMYTSGEYLEKNPTWDVEHSPRKAGHIIRMMSRNGIAPRTVCEVGCGAGEVLRQLQSNMDEACEFWGYEISPQAFEFCQERANERLRFEQKDILQVNDVFFDVILLIDVIEHLEDYLGFLSAIRPKSKYKVLRIPLDLSVQTVLRASPIMEVRRSVGHIHYFTKEIALQFLKDTGYEVLDYFYDPKAEAPSRNSVALHAIKWLRKLLFMAHQDLAVRILGGYSLMVLAK